MSTLGIRNAFAKYGATLRNVQWSVSAWAPDGALVVSLWDHHRRKGITSGVLEFEGSANRWRGAGNSEFRENVARAFVSQADIRLVITSTKETGRVDAGEDGSKIKKQFHVKEEVTGKLIEWDGENYAFRFTKTAR